jgi:DNA-directed RNA polymerase specialized sigma subunit
MIKNKKSPVMAKQVNELVETSKKYIASKVLTKFYNLPIEIDDLESVIYEGVKKALSSYDSNRSSSKASLTS